MLKPSLSFVLLLTLMLASCANPETQQADQNNEPSRTPMGVVGGTTEPDYRYPWVVQIELQGCQGVLIHPRWVLTAAHCVYQQVDVDIIRITRVDPQTGNTYEDKRGHKGPGVYDGIYIHPEYLFNSLGGSYDIALIELDRPFSITPYIQTAGLPSGPRQVGTVGTVASYVHHNMTLPLGQVAIFRAPIPEQPPGFQNFFGIPVSNMISSLCPGDSGSGFVTYENGRAIVRGIVSSHGGGFTDCMTPEGHEEFMDIYAYRDWIFKTIGMTDYFLAGNTRLHWSGKEANDVMEIACLNPYDNMLGPLNVSGVQEGANCEFETSQTVLCWLNGEQPRLGSAQVQAPQVQITGFTMKTTRADGTATVQSLPFSSSRAIYYGFLPFGDYREFTCQIGLTNGNSSPPTNDNVHP